MYETPMIRTLPYGFVYPILRGWPTPILGEEPYEVLPWSDEVEKRRWRGFCIVSRELATFPDHHISELVLDVHQLNTGLNCRVFEEPNGDYENLVTLLRRPGFSRIDLALLADGEEHENWPSFRSGLLRNALSEAKDLQHVSLRTQVDMDQCGDATEPGTNDSVEQFTPLRTIFPIENWQKLQHFGLSNFPVRQDDVLSLLAAMPPTLQSVDLSFLVFLGDGGNYRDLLTNMRDTLGWRERIVHQRPNTMIRIGTWNGGSTVNIWLDEEVNRYLYDDGENPFGEAGVLPGKGVERDPLDF